ncbi:OLC1v1014743C1 [Oldenlandia corymbosa var. corymbosa]|uniref:OLC1v1014743C1 n=1 Tax=Oldenlandia corymbosa var. corymbosa TaxID=529605 RepID=A0AAV1E5A5_OLDCO|nr:OLC1v1014743C1 [Oldenlandia corymbosa var. corymbosa]
MEREARKRKIVDRSSDRLALITGRLQHLETQSPPSTPISSDHHLTKPHSVPPGWGNINNAHINDNDRQHHDYHHPSHLVLEETMKNVSAATQKNGTEPSSLADTRILSTTKEPSNKNANVYSKPAGGINDLLRCFTAKDLNSCIISSENTRVFCSIMIALLVVIAYANLPRHIVKSKSLIASRPLYVLLLTDVIIVILRVIYSKHRDLGSGGDMDMKVKQDMNSKESDQSDDNWDVAMKLLEWGLVLYQTVRALFIDCSFYIVIVICGFAFM